MKAVSGKDLCRLLETRGWELKRIHGSHPIYTKPGVNARISVPVHANRPLKIGLQTHLMKIAGIEEAELYAASPPRSDSHTVKPSDSRTERTGPERSLPSDGCPFSGIGSQFSVANNE